MDSHVHVKQPFFAQCSCIVRADERNQTQRHISHNIPGIPDLHNVDLRALVSTKCTKKFSAFGGGKMVGGGG